MLSFVIVLALAGHAAAEIGLTPAMGISYVLLCSVSRVLTDLASAFEVLFAMLLSAHFFRLICSGWSTWCTSASCYQHPGINSSLHDFCDEEMILSTARAMADNGLLAAGYSTIAIDDCWAATQRDAAGNLQADASRFPHGMAWLASVCVFTSISALTPGSPRNGLQAWALHKRRAVDVLERRPPASDPGIIRPFSAGRENIRLVGHRLGMVTIQQ